MTLKSRKLTPEKDLSAPPVARRIPREENRHGDCLRDDYFWLREKSNPEVAAYLEAENDYAEAMMADTAGLQERLYTEILSHIQQTDVQVPYRQGDWFYYSRTEAGKQYPIYARKRGSLEAAEEITLDLNEMAKSETFLSLGVYEISDDGHLLAYSIDVTGFRQYTLHVKDLRTGEVLPDRLEKTVSAAWAADNKTLFYTVEDHAKRSYRLYRHTLGASQEQTLYAGGSPSIMKTLESPIPDPRHPTPAILKPGLLLYEEADEMFGLAVTRSRSRDYLFLTSHSHTTSEVRFLPAGTPDAFWTGILPRTHGHEYYVDHHSDRFYIRTNSGGRNFRLVTAPIQTTNRAGWRRAQWKEIVKHRESVMLEGVQLFAGHMVLIERFRGLPRFRVVDLRTRKINAIRFPEPAYHAAPDVNAEFDTTKFRYSYQSLVTPRSTFDYDMEGGESALLKQVEVPGGFDRTHYRTERIFAAAPDGVKIPISLVYRAGVKRDGRAPLYLRGYGSYGLSYSITFDPKNLPLLDRGVVLAFAHVRGGGEMGKAWHDQGRMLHKRNTFTDFIACAEHLLARRYGAKERLAASGGSAGGLLMGAVANLRPDLFRAILSYVPFVDVINTMMDADLPLTIGEYEEWGNPNKPEEYAIMKSYCPYTNLEAKDYPAMLIRTSFNDSQVMYWEPAKYVARLRTLKTDANPLLFKTNMAAGHGGASGRYDAFRDTAYDYAFLLRQLGVREK